MRLPVITRFHDFGIVVYQSRCCFVLRLEMGDCRAPYFGLLQHSNKQRLKFFLGFGLDKVSFMWTTEIV